MNLKATKTSLNPHLQKKKVVMLPREEGRKVEMATKSQFTLRIWGLRSRFNSILTMSIALIIVLTIFISMRNGDQAEILAMEAKESSAGTCDLFSGQWVYDNTTYPLYSESGCKFMSDQSACEKFGRRDLKYQNWRWQPHGCDLPRFNVTKLLERLRDRRLVFVGDSLNRNQWISMVCLLGASLPDSHKIMVSNGSLMSFKAKEHNASIDFYWAPLLVESNSDDPVHHQIPDRVARAQSIEKHARHWTNADVLVFNTYLWWRRPTMNILWGSFEDEHGIHKEIDGLRGYELALNTWSDWLEFHVDHLKTKLFFMSMSPTHSSGEDWGRPSGQNCYDETEPIAEEGYWGKDTNENMMRVVEKVIKSLRGRGVNVQMLNITQLSEYRKDGHPSIYRKQWEPLTEEQQDNPGSYADCIHWCLPGVPDVWNQLLNQQFTVLEFFSHAFQFKENAKQVLAFVLEEGRHQSCLLNLQCDFNWKLQPNDSKDFDPSGAHGLAAIIFQDTMITSYNGSTPNYNDHFQECICAKLHSSVVELSHLLQTL